MNANNYYADIRNHLAQLQTKFPDDCCLVHRAGNVCEVPLLLAAELLVKGSHEIATDEQSLTFRTEQEIKRDSHGDPLESARRQFGLLKGDDKCRT